MAGSSLVRAGACPIYVVDCLGVSQDYDKCPLFEHPLSISEGEEAVSSWLAQPVAGILDPGERHWEILRNLLREGQTAGSLVMDAVIAAIAVKHGATLCTTDRDFYRFPALKLANPLETSGTSS
jgi:predicted nucleic acid-binding protein